MDNPTDPAGDPFGVKRGVVPPPPETGAASSLTEVTIRTMATDLALLGQAGGTLPQPAKISLAFKKPEGSRDVLDVTITDGAKISKVRVGGGTWFVRFLAAILIAGALFAAGYFGIPLVLQTLQSKAPEIPTGEGSGMLPQDQRTSPPLEHASLFRATADQAFPILPAIVSSTGKPVLFEDQVRQVLASAQTTSIFIEIVVKGAAGYQVAWSDFIADRGTLLVSKEIFAEKFEPDFTMFVFRDANGVWPGYVLKAKQGQSALTLKSLLEPLEANFSSIARVFLANPGTSSGGFTDALVNGQPIRTLVFSAPGASFTYGWFFNDRFILSTSLSGMREAVRRL